MPHVSTVKDSGLNLDSVCLRSSLSSTVVLPTLSAQSFLLYTELRWQYQSLSVWSLMFPLYATMENWEKYSDSSSTSSSLMSLGGNKRNPLWTPLLVSVQFSCSVVSDSLRPHESQHTRPPRPSPTPGVYPNSCPLSQWSHPTISSSVVPFSSCPHSFPASGSSNESALCIRWPKYWSCSFNINPLKWTPRTDFL